MAQVIFEFAQSRQGTLAAEVLFCWGGGWAWRRVWSGGVKRTEVDATDVEVLFEAVELKEIGEFEGADVATGLADFPLEVADDAGEVGEGEAGLKEVKPEALAVEAEEEALAGEAAIGLVKLFELVGEGRRGRVHGVSWVTQGRSWRAC